jgi:hypothetical protein
MIRSILAVLAAMAFWAALWVGGNAALVAGLPGAFADDGSTGRTDVLLVVLAWSVLLSVAAGWLVARLARRRPFAHALVLGLVQLAIGIGVQLGVWEAMPLWYHLLFLGLQVPAYLVGAAFLGERREPVPAVG